MSARRFHRHFALLALFVMWLLAFAPTINRFLMENAASGTWTEMCTMSGLTWVKVPNGEGAGLPKPIGEMHQDCAYCPLLNAMTALVLLVFAVVPRARAFAIATLCSSSRRTTVCHRGLGSRGPPAYF